MIDIIGTGQFGRDDGIFCDICAHKTYLSSDQGGGLCEYTCENEDCGYSFLVQYDSVEDEDENENEKVDWIDFDEAGYPV